MRKYIKPSIRIKQIACENLMTSSTINNSYTDSPALSKHGGVIFYEEDNTHDNSIWDN